MPLPTSSEAIPTRWSQVRTYLKRIGTKLKTVPPMVRPGPRAARGALIGAGAVVLLLAAYAGTQMLRIGFGWMVDALAGMVFAALVIVLVTGAVMLLLKLLNAWPPVLVGGLAGAVVMVLLVLFGPDGAGLQLALALVVPAAVMGGTVAVLTGPGFKTASQPKQVALVTLLAMAFGAFVALLVWAFQPGSRDHLAEVASVGEVPALETPDPSQPGPYAVRALFYGSGTDRHRPEFGADLDPPFRTEPVDGTPFLEELTGWRASLRHWYWGFDRSALPLNGRVWFPDGNGPFPLVLIVHGNHNMADYSDPGYAYLGELFASRGFITVSVDENFLNGTWMADYDEENDARGWLLLEHLRQWQAWNGTEEHPFYGQVDFDRIALIGHSRGGEAVAVAAALNPLDRYPDDATVTFDYNFNIRGIIAIAPVDGQYEPADRPTPLTDVNYLVLHGAHDSDVSSFSGDRLYRRLRFSGMDYRFKAALYIYEANHGQFNTVWGNRDWGLPAALLLNTEALMPGEEQRQVGKVYMSAFLETVLHDAYGYLPLFQDYRTALDWLPETLYINRFSDSRFRPVADFQEDIDVTTTTVPGGRITGERLHVWREQDLPYRSDGERQNQVVALGWRGPDRTAIDPSDPSSVEEPTADTLGDEVVQYTLHLPDAFIDSLALNAASELAFDLAEADEAVPDDEGEDGDEAAENMDEENEDEVLNDAPGEADDERAVPDERDTEEDDAEEDEPTEPLDLTIVLVDRAGHEAELPLSRIQTLLPPLISRFTRWDAVEERYDGDTEPVLQTYQVSLRHFVEVNPAFNPQHVQAVRLRFDRSPEGVLFLDAIGFRTGAPPPDILRSAIP